ncbi:MAG: penicillin-binding transpeptidase domain-containing protein, partial [Solirubrobacterales bacterium]|nr:penicillin-binding transpeptidase domain-containing protein [Solirubrobacterales bacterium]
AARTYFGQDVNHRGCGTTPQNLCVTNLQPWEAALLAGIIQSPTEYDPVQHPAAALARRNIVLRQMLEQKYLTRSEYDESVSQALPAPKDINPPSQPLIDGVDVGYFSSWVQQQVIERYGATRAYFGGLTVHTTLDLEMQRAAEEAIDGYLPGPPGPGAALVAIENSTGQVRAMVGGRSYDSSPFNLATEGERQPGSSFKAFDLAAALERGISPYSVWTSKVKEFRVPHSHEAFVVHNDENAYSGETSLINATAYSDNSVFAEVGIDVGTKRIANLAHRMGITTPISTNPAMTIGGLKVGVTPLDMAHAYETIAHGGQRVSGTLVSDAQPVGIESVDAGRTALPDGHHRDVDHPVLTRVLPQPVAETETSMLETVLSYGTARAAQLEQFAAGKTGTTTNYGDAWFVGWTHRFTVAVWVGYPTSLVPMTTQFNGGPVLGGTYPALIWHNFMVAASRILAGRANRAGEEHAHGASAGREPSGPPTAGEAPAHAPPAPAGGGGGEGHGSGAPPTSSRESGGAPGPPGHETPAPSSTREPTPSPVAPPPAGEPAPGAGSPSPPSSSTPATGGAQAPAGGTGAPPG